MRNNPVRKLNCGLFPLFFLASPLALFFWQRRTLTPILSLLQIVVELPIALGHLLLAELITILLLLQHKQQISAPKISA